MWRRSHLPQRRAGAWASLLRAEGARPARPAGLPPPLHCLRGLRHVLGPLRVTPHWPAEFLRPPENLNPSQPTLCGSRSAPHGGARAGTAWDLRGQVGGGGVSRLLGHRAREDPRRLRPRFPAHLHAADTLSGRSENHKRPKHPGKTTLRWLHHRKNEGVIFIR